MNGPFDRETFAIAIAILLVVDAVLVAFGWLPGNLALALWPVKFGAAWYLATARHG